MEFKLLLSLFCFASCVHLPFCYSGDLPSRLFEFTVENLKNSQYTKLDGFPCVRLLNLSGEIGCSKPGLGISVAWIVRFKNADDLTKPVVLLVSVDKLENLLLRASRDSEFSKKVVGILVESGGIQNGLKGFSPDEKFPQAEFAPYPNKDIEWNPTGSGIMWKAYNFLVFLLSRASTLILRKAMIVNDTRCYASFDLVMQTTSSRTHDSASCLKVGACLPVGGYIVWSALPPINPLSSVKPKPIVLAMASMDSASFFRDFSSGAESSISLVFMVLSGESRGYLGSRRVFLESDQQSNSIKGLNLNMIETVIEIGSVGKSSAQHNKTFFAHIAGYHSKCSKEETLSALHRAQKSLRNEGVIVKTASTANPGVPPSSLMTFLRKVPHISGLVLEDFDSAFRNEFYHSHLDDLC